MARHKAWQLLRPGIELSESRTLWSAGKKSCTVLNNGNKPLDLVKFML